MSYPCALLNGDQFRAATLRKLGVRPEHRNPATLVINKAYSQSGTTSGIVNQTDLQPVSGAVRGHLSSKRQSECSVIVHLEQQLRNVDLQQPPTKEDGFNSDFYASGEFSSDDLEDPMGNNGALDNSNCGAVAQRDKDP